MCTHHEDIYAMIKGNYTHLQVAPDDSIIDAMNMWAGGEDFTNPRGLAARHEMISQRKDATLLGQALN